MNILGIETSCDETAAAVVADGRRVLSSVVASQIDIHRRYGGVVPEIASRKHVEAIGPVVHQSLEQAGLTLAGIDGIAVTCGPGLVGSLLVGLSMAKAMAFARDIPFVGVNHIEGHIAAVYLLENRPACPFVALVVSGGHTNIYLVEADDRFTAIGQTRDDAAGEALDKAAAMLNLGYPGGVVIDRLSKGGNGSYVAFPKAMRGSYDFSFSGLKTALLYYLRKRERPPAADELPHVVASYQEAVVEVLVEKTFRAAAEFGALRVAVAGGVAANSRLRERFREEGTQTGIQLFIPPPALCTDNAAMIAAAGHTRLSRGVRDPWDLNAVSRWPIDSNQKVSRT